MGLGDTPLIAPRVRFAPSPTGSLHLGNARTALFNWLLARATRGTFVLRIEDTDTDREALGSEAAIFDDLRWLGLTWDEGPDTGGASAPYRQSQRLPIYASAAADLLASRAAFRCFCDAQREQTAHGAGPGHRDPCRALPPEEGARREAEEQAFAVRFLVPEDDGPGVGSVEFHDRLHGAVSVPLPQIGDAVLVRRDGRPTYNFAVVVDDLAMRIDLVLRGDDHLSNTPLQVLLYRAMRAEPPAFAHVPMVLGPDGERLSKRHGATSVAAWRERGVPPEALVNALALLGWAPSNDRTIVSLEEMAGEFALERVGRSAATFDPVKLDWISAQYVHAMDPPRLAGEVGRALVAAGRLTSAEVSASASWIAAVAEFLRPALVRFDQVAALTLPVFHPGGPAADSDRAVVAQPPATALLQALAEAESSDWNAVRQRLQETTGAKGKSLFQPIRIALTGHADGRELDRLWPLIVEGARLLPGAVPAVAARVAATLRAVA